MRTTSPDKIKKLDMELVTGGLSSALTYYKCPKCGEKTGCDHGFMTNNRLNKNVTSLEICEECGYEYEITYKIIVKIKAEYTEPETCKRCDFKEAHEHVS